MESPPPLAEQFSSWVCQGTLKFLEKYKNLAAKKLLKAEDKSQRDSKESPQR
jgi:hypothetical protein